MTALASLGCTGMLWGSGFLLPIFCQGVLTEGDESLKDDKVAGSSIVCVLTGWYLCCNSIWRFVVF